MSKAYTTCANCTTQTISTTGFCSGPGCREKQRFISYRKMKNPETNITDILAEYEFVKNFKENATDKCLFVHRSGVQCNSACIGERCTKHENSKTMQKCINCQKYTGRENGICSKCTSDKSYKMLKALKTEST